MRKTTAQKSKKTVQKGICCTGVRFTRVTYGEEHWYTGIHTATGQGSFAKFQSGVRIRLSRKDPVEDGRRNASIKIHSKKSGTLYFDHRNVFPADVEDGEWRMDFVPNESALDNVFKSIQIVASAETTPLHKLIVQNPMTLSLTPEEHRELVELKVPDQELERVVNRTTVDKLPSIVAFNIYSIGDSLI